jgi:hypothetical protein
VLAGNLHRRLGGALADQHARPQPVIAALGPGLAGLVAIAAGPGRTPEALAAHYGQAFVAIAATLVAVAGAALTLPARRDAA